MNECPKGCTTHCQAHSMRFCARLTAAIADPSVDELLRPSYVDEMLQPLIDRAFGVAARHGVILDREGAMEVAYAADSKSIDGANRSTGNHSLACARVLGPCSLCHVNDQRPNDWLCEPCALSLDVGRFRNAGSASGVESASFDDDPPADWVGLAAWCAVSGTAAVGGYLLLRLAIAQGWL